MRSRAGALHTGLPVSLDQLLVLLAVGLGALTSAFGVWTATSIWSFPLFVVAVALCLYVPGKLMLDIMGVEAGPLEDLTLALVLGTPASSIVFLILAYLGLEHVFILFPVAAAMAYFYRRRGGWRAIRSYRPSLDLSHVLLLGVIVLSLVPLGILPAYYRNADLLPGPSMAYARRPFDAAQHLSFAQELTHSIPPQVPFFSGEMLNYHYGMDLLAAMMSSAIGLSVLDLTVRFLPTFFLVTAVLAVFCFSRLWLDARYGAVLVTFLVVLGEDLSFVPGLLLGSQEAWSAQFFGVPTIYSLYTMNPMLPCLGLLFSGLFCLGKSYGAQSKPWAVLAAFLFAMTAGYKVFATAHVLAALAMAGAIRFVLSRETRLLKVLVTTALLGTPLFLQTLVGSLAGSRIWMRIDPWPYVPEALEQMGLLGTSLASEIGALYEGGALSVGGIAGLFLVALPVYLLGSLGVRVVAIPVVVRDLLCFRSSTGLRLFAGLFVALGPLVTLTCAATPWGYPPEGEYNNAVWFFVQSKYVMWVLAGESLLVLCRGRRRLWQALAVAVVVGLSVPSTIQYFQSQTHRELVTLGEDELELMSFLGQVCANGEVVLAQPDIAEPISALTTCRVPVLNPGTYTHLFVSRAALEERERDMDSFWNALWQGELRTAIACRYEVAFLVIDRASPEWAALQSSWQNSAEPTSAGQPWLDPCFENSRYVVYETRRNDCGD